MAYEDMTYEVILKRMINRVIDKYPNIDYREGSLIYNALSPAALELAIMYIGYYNYSLFFRIYNVFFHVFLLTSLKVLPLIHKTSL